MEGNNAASGSQKNSMLDKTQHQVNEVVNIMRVNVEKVLERDQKLSELDSRADALQEGGKRFEQQAQKLKRKYWWKNLKMMIILGIIAVVILIIIIVSVTEPFSSSDDSSSKAAEVAAISSTSTTIATALVNNAVTEAPALPPPSP